jgi:hypothetical protein
VPTDAYKLLYQGQLPSSVGTLATVGGGVSWIIKHISIVNNDTSARTFALYRQGTADSNIITPPAMGIPAGGMSEWDGTMALAASETLRGVGSVASKLTVTVCGDEVTP